VKRPAKAVQLRVFLGSTKGGGNEDEVMGREAKRNEREEKGGGVGGKGG